MKKRKVILTYLKKFYNFDIYGVKVVKITVFSLLFMAIGIHPALAKALPEEQDDYKFGLSPAPKKASKNPPDNALFLFTHAVVWFILGSLKKYKK